MSNIEERRLILEINNFIEERTKDIKDAMQLEATFFIKKEDAKHKIAYERLEYGLVILNELNKIIKED